MFTKLRNKILRSFYGLILKPIFFIMSPESIHEKIVKFGSILGHFSSGRTIIKLMYFYKNSMLQQNICGINFANPIGLSAGLDKDAKLMEILPSVGFGFEEIGSITAKPFAGNEGRWLYRLIKEKALRVNYGLKNIGAEKIYKKFADKKFKIPIGISIAKTNIKETSELEIGIEDYFYSYQLFQNAGDYITINISCPNTCENSPIFAVPENLELLLQKLFSIKKNKPVFIKLSPDLEDEQLDKILELGNKFPIDGFICTNLTKKNLVNHQGKGGFSGKLVEELANKMIAKVYGFYHGKKIIIGCGGVFSAEDAYKKIKLGANLIQLITGMIYEGPQLISEINCGLAELLQRDGFKSIGEAVGKDTIIH